MADAAKEHFANQVLSKLNAGSSASAQAPVWALKAGDFKLELTGSDLDVSLTASYEQYSKTEDLGKKEAQLALIVIIIQGIRQAHDEQLDWSKTQGSVLPRIRPTSWVEAQKDLIHSPFHKVEALKIVFIIKRGMSATSVTKRHLDAWNVDAAQVLTIAVANLSKIATSKPTKWSKTDVGVEPDWNDDLAAARVLVPSLFDGARELLPGGDIVVIIPYDEKIVVTSSHDTVGLTFLGEALMDFKNIAPEDDDEESEESDEREQHPPISITDVALRLTSTASWVAYVPEKEEGRIPTSRAEATMLLEAIEIAVHKMAAASNPSATKKCGVCSKTDAKTLKACSRCKLVSYCSRECQVAHWPSHKKDCKPA